MFSFGVFKKVNPFEENKGKILNLIEVFLNKISYIEISNLDINKEIRNIFEIKNSQKTIKHNFMDGLIFSLEISIESLKTKEEIIKFLNVYLYTLLEKLIQLENQEQIKTNITLPVDPDTL